MLRKIIILGLAVAQLIIPVLLQSNGANLEIKKRAEMDAERNVNSLEWLTTGFFMMPIGIVSAKRHEPSIPSTHTVGKSYKYLKVYTKHYKSKSKQVQTKYAKIGCLTGSIFWASVIFAVVRFELLSKEHFM